jgi:hypothetical protein
MSRSCSRRAAQGAQAVDDGSLDPDQPLALSVELRLIADAAERQGGGDGVEGGGGDGRRLWGEVMAHS